MATTPVTKAPPAAHTTAAAPAPPAPELKHPTLEPEAALRLFQTGHRIAKHGDPQTKWISMSRGLYGEAVLTTPVTEEILETIKTGDYYLVDEQ